MLSSVVISQWTVSALPPAFAISATTCAPPSMLMSAIVTSAPSAAIRIAHARPMPDAAPVLIALLPESLPTIPLLLVVRRPHRSPIPSRRAHHRERAHNPPPSPLHPPN